MSHDAQREQLARLLSGRDEASVLEKEEILSAVLARVQPRRQRRLATLRWLLAPLAVAGAATAIVLAVHPLRSPRDELLSRGSPPSQGFELNCERGKCQEGARLYFRVRPAVGSHYFSAFAERKDGTVIWYFPGATQQESLLLSERTAGDVLLESVILGSEHAPGDYRVTGIFSSAPLSKDEIKRGLTDQTDSAKNVQKWVVQERPLTVE